MTITWEEVKRKGVDEESFWKSCEQVLKTEYPEGMEYQELLNLCAENGWHRFAVWLLQTFGRTNDLLRIDGEYPSDASLYVCGNLKATGPLQIRGHILAAGTIMTNGDIQAGRSIQAGRGILTGRSIQAGGAIRADSSIRAGRDIRAGRSIQAGGGIRADWDIHADEDIQAGEDIRAGWGIRADRGIRADWDIRADSSIQAGRDIRAGWNIRAGGDIQTGENYGIYAGLHAPISDRGRRTISARSKPDNIQCGIWEGNDRGRQGMTITWEEGT